MGELMGMFESFFDMCKCPKCQHMVNIEFQTKMLGQRMNTFNVNDKVGVVGLEINYGEITDAIGTCPNCETHLKGIIRIVAGKFAGMRDIKIWEIKN